MQWYKILEGPEPCWMRKLASEPDYPDKWVAFQLQKEGRDEEPTFRRGFEIIETKVADDGLGYNFVAKGPGNTTVEGYYDPERISKPKGRLSV